MEEKILRAVLKYAVPEIVESCERIYEMRRKYILLEVIGSPLLKVERASGIYVP